MRVVRFEKDGLVGSIIHANPPENHIDIAFTAQLREAIKSASESDIRALLVYSEGENFALGGNPDEWVGKDSNWFRTFLLEVTNAFKSLEALRIPTIAVVNGQAFGGGFEYALHCDFMVVEEKSVLLAPETMVGMVPVAGGVPRLVARAGLSRAKRILFFPQPITGLQAFEWGIATHLAPNGTLSETAKEVAQRLANGPTRAYVATKALLKTVTETAMADQLLFELSAELYDSADVRGAFATLDKHAKNNLKSPQEIFKHLTFSGK